MPSVNISEIDETTSGGSETNDYVILVPGMLGSTAPESGGLSIGDEYEFDNQSDFESMVGTVAQDKSYIMAYKLLGLGCTVLYRVVSGESDLVDSLYAPYEDRGNYDLRTITCGGYANKIAAKAAITCAAERGDATAILSVPDVDESGASINTTALVDAYTQAIEDVSVTRKDGTVENGMKYSSIFAPSVNYKTGENLPASYDYLSCFATYISSFSDWFAFAGSVRGVSPSTISSVSLNFGDADIAVLEAREVNVNKGITSNHRATNVVSKINPYGYLVWGNRTMYPLGDGLVASSFLNIRQLCCSLKKTMYRAARKYTFEPNSDVLWVNFVNQIKPLLEKAKSGQGINGYKITRLATDKKATLKANITIIPIEAVEDFNLTVTLSDSIEDTTVTEG